MDLAWFLLMLHCGLRTCEIRHLKLQDIEWDAKRLRIEQSKALKDRQIYLDEAVLGALRSYLAVRGQADALPQNVFIFRHAPLSRTYCSARTTQAENLPLRFLNTSVRYRSSTIISRLAARTTDRFLINTNRVIWTLQTNRCIHLDMA